MNADNSFRTIFRNGFDFDGAFCVNRHFPGGRFDASVRGEEWTLVRTDFIRDTNGFRSPETVVATGRGAETLRDAISREMDARVNGTPVVGGPATFVVATDCHACTVVSVDRNGTRATLRRDKASLLNGVNSGESDALHFEPGGFVGHTSGEQRYAYEPDPNGATYVVSRRVRRNGEVVWKKVGHGANSPGLSATFTERSEHYDFNF